MDAWASTSAKQADIISASHNGQNQQSNQVGIRRRAGCFFRAEKGREEHSAIYMEVRTFVKKTASQRHYK